MKRLTANQRAKLPSRCFLKPGQKKYPVCGPISKKLSCDHIKAARRRAILQRDRNVERKAKALAVRHSCYKGGK